ncbi:transcriptional regulator [Aquitalea sp. S1-19]|nr:transcriptional regulator [Aquitalea sp. S1-19]MCP9760542.1 transcriptional regulator [Aquitalea sp. S1-19]MCP9760570.1 transcriptional regulator [Aquitalea sp. S1-19]MCP9760582.1 transcriptional regulator [Aquitalea sp. S1-19]MCP9760607.1 transcriptional regulator [Aquitalea sp. S1-19]
MQFRFCVFFGMLLAPLVQAGPDDDWALLGKAAQVARQQTLSGSYLHQIGSASETFRIQRSVSKGKVRERRVSLDGLPREIIRHGDVLITSAPDEHSLLAAKISSAKLFPAILPDNVAMLADGYALSRLGSDRVASRECQWWQLKSLEAGQRYTQRVCLDKASQLPLKWVTLDAQQDVVELFSFIDLDDRAPRAKVSVQPVYPLSAASSASAVKAEEGVESLEIKGIPPGFRLLRSVMRKMPGNDGAPPVQHRVYSDGLAVFSLFVEYAKDAKPAPHLTHGPISVATDNEGEYRLTLVGDLPDAGLQAIARHLRLVKKS